MENVSKLEEPLTEYITIGLSIKAMVMLFGGFSVLKYNHSISSDFDLLELTRQGLPKKALLNLAKKISFSFQELADVMHISERTLQRFPDDGLVKSEYSEKAIELAKLYARGEEVFGSLDKFKLWMKTPSLIFKNQTPASLLDTSIGFDLILKELGRIEHGIFA